jgi:hypothetical protein
MSGKMLIFPRTGRRRQQQKIINNNNKELGFDFMAPKT